MTYLAHAAALPALADVEVEMGIVSTINDDEAGAILSLAQARQADAIVLCGQGPSTASDWGLSNVAQRVVRAAAMPVLAVPEYGADLYGADLGLLAAGGAGQPWRRRPLRAVVALDGSPHAEAVLDLVVPLVVELAAPRPAALHLLHVALDGETAVDAKAYLSSVAYDLRTGPFADDLLAPTWLVVREGDVARAVLVQAAECKDRTDDNLRDANGSDDMERLAADDVDDGERDSDAFPGADIIVMATFGHRGSGGWDTERIVERVLRLARVPVLLMRPPVDEPPAMRPNEAFAADHVPLAGLEQMLAEDVSR